ncbi:hypothetical protein SVAN01_11090 [Stagonosporopsis vannaccii]|nr:hypothetical protein SVAN01_11090 [Stagonosporopsis vannaccii]
MLSLFSTKKGLGILILGLYCLCSMTKIDLSSADERAVSVQREFGTEPFQIGTNALMGCTIVVLVSRTNVWMSHLWEAYSNGGDDSPTNRAFEERVVDFIKGRTVTNPAASPIMQNEPWRLDDPKKKNDFKAYITPTGPGVDPNVFKSERGQRISLHIMAPTSREATSNDFPLRYPNHVASIANAIKDQLGGKKPATVPTYKYVTLDPDNVPADEKKIPLFCLVSTSHLRLDLAQRSSTMEALPPLASGLVCKYLLHNEPHKASLLAFASTSRACRAAAWRELFAEVSIDIDDLQFDQRLTKLECILDEANSRACIKVLKLSMRTDRQIERNEDEIEGTYGSGAKLVPNIHSIRPIPEWRPQTWPQADKCWETLAQFISTLHLKELVWASTRELPRCIISVLNKQLPTCRLHIYGFDLRSLHQRGTLQDIEETEYLLATSPCLYSISAPYSRYDASGCANYNGEATLRLSSGLAPNLRHVCVWDNSVMSSGEIRSRSNARPDWRGFHPQSDRDWRELPEIKGQLQSLTVHARYAVSGLQLASWERHTNFSILRSLQLANQIELDVLRQLTDLAEQDGLACLRSLSVPAIACEYEERANAELMMTRLCASLQPLVELSVVGPGVTSFEAILKRHGDNLQVFCVKGLIMSAPQVVQLRDVCPMIRKLSLEIMRSAGDQIEVAIYRTLGSMRNLENLSLMLHCTDYRPGDGPDDPVLLTMPSDDKDDQEAMAFAIRQVFVNAALDRNLARSICENISAAHALVKGALLLTLNSIRLRIGSVPALNDQIMGPDFESIIAWIGRSWLCRRDPRDTHRSELIIDEVDGSTRLCHGKRLEDDIEELSGSEQYADIWRALWPKTGAGWKEEWHSIPLASDSEPSRTLQGAS